MKVTVIDYIFNDCHKTIVVNGWNVAVGSQVSAEHRDVTDWSTVELSGIESKELEMSDMTWQSKSSNGLAANQNPLEKQNAIRNHVSP